MASINQWIAGTRPRTLPAAISPVVVGAGLAAIDLAQVSRPVLTLPNFVEGGLALLVALALQVGVNFANDYSDGIRGTDQERVGPVRLVGQGLAAAAKVKVAAFSAFACAAVFGLGLVLLTGHLFLIALGALAIISAWFYTGGQNPYGYRGLGEAFVFVWFGLAAVLGTEYVISDSLNRWSLPLAVAAGSFACALLVVNNLRDIPSDTLAGKRTLAVQLGDAQTRWLYVGLVWVGLGTSAAIIGLSVLQHSVNQAWLGLGLVAAISAHVPGRAVINGATGRELVQVLGATSRTQVIWAIATFAGVMIYLR